MSKVMVFIDGTWLYYSKNKLGEAQSDDFNIDYGKLPKILAQEISKQMDNIQLDVVRSFLFGSYAWNFDERDAEFVDRQKDFFSMLKERYHYTVDIFPINFKGRRLRKSDRDSDDTFEPREKCVDISLASSLMYHAAIPNAFDIALVVIGDQNFAPVLRTARMLGKRVAIASVKTCCCMEFSDPYNSADIKDFDIIWLDDLLPSLELQFKRKQLRCESPLHNSDELAWTTYDPRKGEKFYCDDCRSQFSQNRDKYVASIESFPSSNADEEIIPEIYDIPEMEIAGFIKTKFSDRGFGFIHGEDGYDYFFHLSDLHRELDFEFMEDGMPVLFEITKPSVSGKAGAAQNIRSGEFINDEDDMEFDGIIEQEEIPNY